MSFITRCPSCGTAFRVVTDQLRISEGWVRCGHCQHVFDATLDLQPWWPDAPTAASRDLLLEPAVSAELSIAPPEAQGEAVPDLEPEAEPEPQPEKLDLESVESHVDVKDALAEAQSWPDIRESVVTDPVDMAVCTVEPVLEPAPISEQAPLLVDDTPAFVRQAQQRALWHQPWVRSVLLVLILLFVLGLLVQVLMHTRNEAAARWPALRPLLQTMCKPLGCLVEAPRSLQSVSIDSSALRRSPSGGYIFEMVVKNASQQTVLTPALELTLTDAADRVLVRRVLPSQEWPQAVTTLALNSEHSVRLEWQLGEPEAQTMAGYRALLFYP